MYKLIIEDDEGKTTVVPLIRDEISIGRKEGNTIRLTERNVSRRHARILRQNGTVYIEDLQSYNGVKVNSDRVQGRAPIGEGDRIQIGDYQLSLKVDRPEAKAPEAKAPAAAPAPAAQVAAGEGPTSQFVKPEPHSAATVVPNQPLAPTLQHPAMGAPTAVNGAPAPAAAPDRPARLLVVSKNFFGQEFALDKAAVVIGRTDENDVVINHRSISRHHAKIVREGSHYHIVDLQSANGVRVNGEEYGKVELRKGDKIDLGHVRLVFVPPGQDFDLKGKGEDTEGGERRLGLTVALVILVLAAGAGVAVKVFRGNGPGASGTRDADGDAAQLLVDIDVDLQAKRWAEAATKAEQLTKRTEVSQSKRELAASKRDRAEQEKKNQEIYDRFRGAGGSNNYDDALKIYKTLPQDSVYRQMAQEMYDGLFPMFVNLHMKKAQEAKTSGDCATFKQEVQQVLDVEPKNIKATSVLEEGCGTKTSDDGPDKGNDAPIKKGGTKKGIAKVGPDKPGGEKEPKEPDNGSGEDPKQEENDAILRDAQTAFINGDPHKAIELARSAGKSFRAWRIIGGAACNLKDLKLVSEAYRRLDLSGKQYLVYACMRQGIVFSGGTFKLASE